MYRERGREGEERGRERYVPIKYYTTEHMYVDPGTFPVRALRGVVPPKNNTSRYGNVSMVVSYVRVSKRNKIDTAVYLALYLSTYIYI